MMRATKTALALRRTTPALGAYGKWDTRQFGDMMRNFKTRELTEGYHAHSAVGWMEDFHGNQTMPSLPFWARFKRGYGPMVLFWFFVWSEYYCHMSHKCPGAPWSDSFDPSRERSF